MELTAERARELLDYNPETGTFTWRVGRGNARAGSRAGYKRPDGYVFISVDGKNYYAHRLAWLMTHGVWPTSDTDHINGVTGDNRISNLREASRALNLQNQRVPSANNTSGYLGVSFDSNRQSFNAKISIQGKGLNLGYFHDVEEAYQAYLTAKRRLHPGCTI